MPSALFSSLSSPPLTYFKRLLLTNYYTICLNLLNNNHSIKCSELLPFSSVEGLSFVAINTTTTLFFCVLYTCYLFIFFCFEAVRKLGFNCTKRLSFFFPLLFGPALEGNKDKVKTRVDEGDQGHVYSDATELAARDGTACKQANRAHVLLCVLAFEELVACRAQLTTRL